MDWGLSTHGTYAPSEGPKGGARRSARFMHGKTSKACLLLLFSLPKVKWAKCRNYRALRQLQEVAVVAAGPKTAFGGNDP